MQETLMREYVKYYNKMRPHQGIGNKLPDKTELKKDCNKIKKEAVLFGLYTSYSLAA